jgi:DNA gyrase inhibitor GyrI
MNVSACIYNAVDVMLMKHIASTLQVQDVVDALAAWTNAHGFSPRETYIWYIICLARVHVRL